MRLLILLSSLLWASALCAVDLHVCDCAAGAAAGCVAGNDANDGLTPQSAWRSYERARMGFAAMAAGDRVRFCRGGAHAVTAPQRWVNASCRAKQRCTIGAYGEPGLPLPLLLQSNGAGISFENPGAPTHEEGYVLENLELRCAGCANDAPGIFLYNDIDDVLLRGLRIRGFGIGIYLAGAQPCAPNNPGCDRANQRLTVFDSRVEDSRRQGFLGAGDDLTIAQSHFEGNGGANILDHNIYLAGSVSRVRVLNNTLRRSSAIGTGVCTGASLVAHGQIEDLLIEANLIEEPPGAVVGSCWGINLSPGTDAPEFFRRAILRSNRIHNVGQTAIAVGICSDCVVENNVIVQQQAPGTIGISAPAPAFGSGDALLQNLIVRNNSIYISATNSIGIRLGGEGSGHQIVSNAIQSVAVSGSFACLDANLPAASYAAINHNVCGFVAGAGREWELGSGTIAQWRAASGFDFSSIHANPGYAAPGGPAFDLQAAGGDVPMVQAGHAVLSSDFDFLGAPRSPPPDAGAREWQADDHLFASGFE